MEIFRRDLPKTGDFGCMRHPLFGGTGSENRPRGLGLFGFGCHILRVKLILLLHILYGTSVQRLQDFEFSWKSHPFLRCYRLFG